MSTVILLEILLCVSSEILLNFANSTEAVRKFNAMTDACFQLNYCQNFRDLELGYKVKKYTLLPTGVHLYLYQNISQFYAEIVTLKCTLV